MFTSHKTLELDKIIEKLQSYTACCLGKEAIDELEVISDLEQLNLLLDETDEALRLLYRMGDLPFGGITEIKQSVKRSTIGGILDINSLVAISSFIYGVQQIKLYLEKVRSQEIECVFLNRYIDDLIHLKDLRKAINACIDENGKVYDDASAKLRQIRTQIKTFESRIKEKLNSIVNTKRDLLSESIVTIRNDRFVVPVKVEHKNSFEGIIHDQSQSGSTVYIEPKVIVDINNQLNTLLHEEKKEIEKILKMLTIQVSEYASELYSNRDIVKYLDFVFAKAKYAREIDGIRPHINNDGIIKIYKGRHPLINRDEVVANDIYLGEDYSSLIITGPNTGGKTVTLKTVGLFTLMMQSGLLIPANENSTLAVFDNVFADIGDEQSIEQSLSTFSSHMKNIVHIVNDLTLNSLILFDELGAGTDPKEGAALAMSILDYFKQRGARVIATTHYSELKTYAYNTKGVLNASVEFSVETLKPTYKLLIGVPGRSNALEISRRLGLNEKIIDEAKNKIQTEKDDVSDLITSLEDKGIYLEKLIDENELLKKRLTKERDEFNSKIDKIELEKEQVMTKAKQEAVQIIKKAQKQAESVISELKELKKKQNAVIKEHEIIDIKGQLNTDEYYQEKQKVSKTSDLLQPGNTVKVLTLNRTGTLIEQINDTMWLVQIGILSSKIESKYLELIEVPNKQEKDRRKTVKVVKNNANVGTELDLRGDRYEEAMMKLDKFIDSALLNNYHQVSIIHGHGTGALRKGVREYLKKLKNIESFRHGGDGEGGVGVTVVTFK